VGGSVVFGGMALLASTKGPVVLGTLAGLAALERTQEAVSDSAKLACKDVKSFGKAVLRKLERHVDADTVARAATLAAEVAAHAVLQ